MKPHPSKAIENRFILSMLLTAVILVAEVIGGYWTGSLALGYAVFSLLGM
jgi:Co/Zn/Cd efflux system component